MGFFRQEYWSGLTCPSPGDLPNPGIEPRSIPLCSRSIHFSSVTQSCPNLWDPKNSMPGFPVHHQLWSLLKLMFIESVMPSNHLILCHPLLLPSVFPSTKVFPKSQFFAYTTTASRETRNTGFFTAWANLIGWKWKKNLQQDLGYFSCCCAVISMADYWSFSVIQCS